MRGLLSFSILFILTKGEQFGQEIADELEKMRGTRPTPGTLYPALSLLEKNGMVTIRKEGRKTLYNLTEEGKQGAKTACEYFCRAYEEIFKNYSPTSAQG